MIDKHAIFTEVMRVFPFNFKQSESPLSEKRRHLLSEHPEEADSQSGWVEAKTSKVGSEQRRARRGIWSTDTYFLRVLKGKKCPLVTSPEDALLSSQFAAFPLYS